MADFLALNISNSASDFLSEKRFRKDISIIDLKMKLELVTGCHASTMKLHLYGQDDAYITELSDDEALLGSLQIDNGMRIHVIDPTMHGGEFDDVSKVTKFEISESEYAKRDDSVRAFKERHKMGQFKEETPEERAAKDEKNAKKLEEEKEALASFKIGDRCLVKVPNLQEKLGCIRYLGETDFKEGLWVGVQYDEPLGKNDGSVGGRRYFDCPPKYGGFVKIAFVAVGDFPPDDLGLSDDGEM